MELQEVPDKRQAEILPIVYYAARHRAGPAGDYWDKATALELTVLSRNPDGVAEAVKAAISLCKAPWELETTIRNISLIRERRQARGEDVAWIAAIERQLDQARKIVETHGQH
jgi:hypothetical protein